MPKLLSRSKHEEFKVKLSIAYQRPEERIAENRKKWSIIRMIFLRALCILLALFILLPVPAFYVVPCLHLFLVFSHFILVIAFRSWFFCNFPYTEHLYKPQSVQTLNQSNHFTLAIDGGRQFRNCFLLSPFSFIFSPFLGYQTLL